MDDDGLLMGVEELEKELDRLGRQYRNIDSPNISDIEQFRKDNLTEG